MNLISPREATAQVHALTQSGLQTVRDTSNQLLDSAQRAGRQGVDYVRDEPVKALLIAAVFGATLTAAVALAARALNRRSFR